MNFVGSVVTEFEIDVISSDFVEETVLVFPSGIRAVHLVITGNLLVDVVSYLFFSCNV